jgi:hypothetical protein
VRDEPAVDLENHRRVTVTELPRDEFERDTSPEILDRPMVAAVVQAEPGQPERSPLPSNPRPEPKRWARRLAVPDGASASRSIS